MSGRTSTRRSAGPAWSRPPSLIILDVDRFKSYNDTYGHQSGDRVLMVVAGLLRQHADGADLAIRLGGEEFALLLPGADESRSLGIAEVIRKSVERFRWPQGSITASLGISTLRPCTEQATELVEEADVALYYSKSRGRNRAAHYRELVRLSRAGRSKPVIIPADRLVSRRRLRDFPV
ncbi:MAG: GGDEF domain-containing protein [Isosphaeraceae bacterium]